jgi:hypothetical protein
VDHSAGLGPSSGRMRVSRSVCLSGRPPARSPACLPACLPVPTSCFSVGAQVLLRPHSSDLWDFHRIFEANEYSFLLEDKDLQPDTILDGGAGIGGDAKGSPHFPAREKHCCFFFGGGGHGRLLQHAVHAAKEVVTCCLFRV